MNNAYVLVSDGAAATAVAASEKSPGTKYKVHVQNTVAPFDVLTVDGWWTTEHDAKGFNYMDGGSNHVVHIPHWQIEVLLQRN